MKLINKGFTLIELMIVIAIIGILASVVIPAMQGSGYCKDTQEKCEMGSNDYSTNRAGSVQST